MKFLIKFLIIFATISFILNQLPEYPTLLKIGDNCLSDDGTTNLNIAVCNPNDPSQKFTCKPVGKNRYRIYSYTLNMLQNNNPGIFMIRDEFRPSANTVEWDAAALVDGITIKNVNSCLEMNPDSGSPTTRVIATGCTGGKNQKWFFQGVGFTDNDLLKSVVETYDYIHNVNWDCLWGGDNGDNVFLKLCDTNEAAQKWKFVRMGENRFRIVSFNDKAIRADGDKVVLTSLASLGNSDAATWYISPYSNSVQFFIHGNNCLTFGSSVTSVLSRVYMSPCKGTTNQFWYFKNLNEEKRKASDAKLKADAAAAAAKAKADADAAAAKAKADAAAAAAKAKTDADAAAAKSKTNSSSNSKSCQPQGINAIKSKYSKKRRLRKI